MEVLQFYGWWQFAVCLFAFAGLMAIWYHLGRKQTDHGQIWLALSVLCWSFSGLIDATMGGENSSIADGARSILSLLNSLFILLSLPWFRYIPPFLKPLIKSKNWIFIVGLPFLFSLLPTISKLISGKSGLIINELDVYYSILTLLFLGIVLWESFAKRRLIMLAWLSAICILITFVAQLYKMTDQDINLTLFSAIFKSCLIMIFFALALSWVKDIAEKMSPAIGKLALRLSNSKIDGHLKNMVALEGIKANKIMEFELTNTHFDLLKTFATRRKEGEGWLIVKPKQLPFNPDHHDIKDYNQVKRLLHAILDNVYGKDLWSKEQHEEPLKAELFEGSEKRDRKIRLRIDREQISFFNGSRPIVV